MSFGRSMTQEEIDTAARAMNSGVDTTALFPGGLRGSEHSAVVRRANELAADERAKQAAAQAEQDAKRPPAEVKAAKADAAFRNSLEGLAKMTPEERYAHAEANGVDPRLIGLGRDRITGKVHEEGGRK